MFQTWLWGALILNERPITEGNLMRKNIDYDREQYAEDCKTMNSTELREKYGISSTTVRNWCRQVGVECQVYCQKCGRNHPKKEEPKTDIISDALTAMRLSMMWEPIPGTVPNGPYVREY